MVRSDHQGDPALTSREKAPEQSTKAASAKRVPGAAAQSKNRDMGAALRSVYHRTVEESVPDDLMSLLSKLD